MKKNTALMRQCLFMIFGELAVSAITAAVYAIVGAFSYKVITGAALGAAVTIANYLILTLSVDRAVRQFEEKRGKAEMTEEEAHAFTEENKKAVQLRIQLSFIVRALSLLGCLVLAFVSGQFEVIATLVPLVMMRPILMAEGYIRVRREAKEKTEAKD